MLPGEMERAVETLKKALPFDIDLTDGKIEACDVFAEAAAKAAQVLTEHWSTCHGQVPLSDLVNDVDLVIDHLRHFKNNVGHMIAEERTLAAQ